MKMYNYTMPLPASERLASGIVLASFASLVFLTACVILFLYHWKRMGRLLVETRIGIVVFFLCALLTTLVSLCSYSHQKVYGIYKLFLASFVGVLFLFAGTIALFDNPSLRELSVDNRSVIPVGHTSGSMGIVIWVIALPLCVLEMLFAIGATFCNSPAPVYASVKFVCLLQKLIQASIYHFGLRHKVPGPLMHMGCSWFLKTVSFFNFAFWIDSIVTTHRDNGFVMKLFGNGFSIVKTAYNSLIIDYRLLCSLLFLEHALEIENAGNDRTVHFYEQTEDLSSHDDQSVVPARPQADLGIVDVKAIHFSGYGYVIGVLCISLQLVNGLQYLNLVGNWTSTFPILCNLVIVVAGIVLVNGETELENENITWRETESKAIDVMIGFMGAVGFVYRIIKSSLCLIWSFQTASEQLQNYLTWNSSKEAVRAVSIVFQLYFFVKVGPHFCQEERNRRRHICHLLVPAIMLALLSTFVSCIIDQYNGEVEILINQSKLALAVTSFMDAAAPIHLGFSLHMFLHFYIIKRNMRETTGFVSPKRSVGVVRKTLSINSQNEDEGLVEPLLPTID